MEIYLVYEEFHHEFLAFAISLTRDSSKGEDLVQEAYIRGLKNKDIFEIMNSYQIKGWFFTTIKNINIDNIRKNSRLSFTNEYDYISDENNFEDVILVRELVENLPEIYSEAIELRYYQGLNSNEIGERLNISPSTVRSRLSNGIRLLKNEIEY